MLTRRMPDAGDESPHVLLQHRADWVHHGGTWSVPGGAIQHGENAWQAALREVTEETGFDLSHASELGRHVDDHGGWSYTTIIAGTDVVVDLDVVAIGEQQNLVWLAVAEVDALPLHPGFVDSWPTVRALVTGAVEQRS